MYHIPPRLLAIAIPFALIAPIAAADNPAWVDAMRKVHAQSTGTPGVLIHLGDSITYSMAYFAPLQFSANAKMPSDSRRALRLIEGYMKEECFRWKGPDKGNDSGKTAAWGAQNIDRWITELQPEIALIMFGSNDIRYGTLEAHEKNLRELTRKCLDHKVVVILSTIPPMHGHNEEVNQAVKLQRKVAADFKVPLIDFYAHVINRRPDDWNGALPQFESFEQWQVPTIISRDGVHPSYPDAWKDDYTEDGLCRNGNLLRTYLTLMAYAEVIDVVVHGRPPGVVSRIILGPEPPKPADLPSIEVRRPRFQRPRMVAGYRRHGKVGTRGPRRCHSRPGTSSKSKRFRGFTPPWIA